MGKSMSKAAAVRVTGPLAPFADGYADALRQWGYAPGSAVHQVRLMAHLSRWLAERGWSGADLTEERVAEFLAARREAGCSLHYGRRAMTLDDGFPCRAACHPSSVGGGASGERGGVGVGRFRGVPGLGAGVVAGHGDGLSRPRAPVPGRLHRRRRGGRADLRGRDPRGRRARPAGVGRVGCSSSSWRCVRCCGTAIVRGLVDTDLSAAALAGDRVGGRRCCREGSAGRGRRHCCGSCDRRRRDRPARLRGHCCCCCGWGCGPARSPRCGWTTSTGGPARSWCTARATASTSCRCRSTSARRSPRICAAAAARATRARGVPDGDGAADRPLTPARRVAASCAAPCVRAGLAPVGPHRLRHTAGLRRCCAPACRLPEIGQVLRHREPGQHRASTPGSTSTSSRTLARPWPAEARDERALPTTCDDYLRLRRALGFKLAARRARCCRSSPPTSTQPAPRRSPPSWRSPGRGCPRRRTRSTGRTGSARCAGSPATCDTIDPAHRDPAERAVPATRAAPDALPLFRRQSRPADAARPGSCARRCGRRPTRALFGLLAASGHAARRSDRA